jgi:glycosyltransferase involved in cell wall biosynthesis
MAPRVLIVAYDFPPHGAIGTMRTMRLVRELSRQGWDITVLTGSPETYLPGTPVDSRLESQVPAGVNVIRARAVRGFDAIGRAAVRLRGGTGTNTKSPASTTGAAVAPASRSYVRRSKDWIDAALSIPDKESGWIAPATLRGIHHMMSAGRPDVIYSSAPPWSGQVVALALAAASRRPWIADFRDPWARAPWRDWLKPFRQRAAAGFERRVVGAADAVLFVTRANLEEFSAFYGSKVGGRFHLVPNGCDPEEFESIQPLPRREEFVLLHAGALYGARNPLPVIQATARAINRGALDRQRFRLRFLGTTSLSTDLPAGCRQLGIEDVVEFVPRVARAESLRELKSASALLLVQTGTTVSVPGKAYEYLAAGRPILALSEEGETAQLVRASGIGRSVGPADPIDVIEQALLEVLALASGNYSPPPRSLFDGVVHARATVRLLEHHARRGCRRSSVDDSVPVTRTGAAIEDTRR